MWAFNSLYAMVNGGPGSGLHRLTDSDGDGELDRDEHIVKMDGGGEHGPHAVILSPDGKSIYICAGNHTKLPAKIDGSMIPQNWSEDLLLPRRGMPMVTQPESWHLVAGFAVSIQTAAT